MLDFISAEHVHTYDKNGPYGYSEFSHLYDKLVYDSFMNNSIDEILKIE